MNSFYLLSYNKTSLGIYNKLYYLFDYLLELVKFPDNNFDIYKVNINIFRVNIGYPLSTLIFNYNKKLNKIYFEETNGKKVEMCPETFIRFNKIQKYFTKVIKSNNIRQLTNQLKTNESTEKLNSKEELKSKEEIYEINRLKYQMKTLEKWKNKFDTDLKIYKDFKEKVLSEDFIIPEMFQELWDFFNNTINSEESFTDYFIKFNSNSDIELNEIEKLLDNTIEIDSENEDSENKDSENEDSENI